MHRLTKLALLAAIALAPLAAHARSSYLSTFNSTYGTSGTALDSCNLCHPNGTSSFNSYANDFGAANHSFRAIEGTDSDRDGFTNLQEIQALTFPGDARSVPAPAAAPKIAVSSTSLAFGNVNVGSSSQQQTTVSNTGSADLTVTVARCSGTSAEFTASPASFTVAPNGRQAVSVTYAPSAAGSDTGCIAVAHNDSTTTTVNVAVSGAGQDAVPPPPAVLDVDITRFGVARRLDLSRGAVASPTVSVVNAGTATGTATISVEGVDAAGVVVYSSSQDVLLAPAATAKVKLTPEFNPAGLAAGQYTFTATVVDADPDVDVASVTVKVIP